MDMGITSYDQQIMPVSFCVCLKDILLWENGLRTIITLTFGYFQGNRQKQTHQGGNSSLNTAVLAVSHPNLQVSRTAHKQKLELKH